MSDLAELADRWWQEVYAGAGASPAAAEVQHLVDELAPTENAGLVEVLRSELLAEVNSTEVEHGDPALHHDQRAAAVSRLQRLGTGRRSDLAVAEHLHRAHAAAFSGDPDDADHHLLRAQQLGQGGDPAVASALEEATGVQNEMRGDEPRAAECYGRAHALAPDAFVAARCALRAAACTSSDPLQAASWYRAAASHAERADDNELRAWCLAEASQVAGAEGIRLLEMNSSREAASVLRAAVDDLDAALAAPDEPHAMATRARLLTWQGTALAEIGEWTNACASFTRALRDLARTDRPDWTATTRLAWGNAALRCGDVATARRELTAAEPLLRSAGAVDAVTACRVLRAAVSSFEQGIIRPDAFAATSEDEELQLLLDATRAGMSALAALGDGDLVGAEQAARLTLDLGELVVDAARSIGARVVLAQIALARKDEARWSENVAALRELATTPGAPPTTAAVLRLMEGQWCRSRGDVDEAIVALADSRAAALAVGAQILAAQMAIAMAELLLASGRPRDAAELAVPAAIALDAHRFTLRSSVQRHAWSAVVSSGVAVAYRAAARTDARLLAELIEVLRGTGVPLALPVDLDLGSLVLAALSSTKAPADPPVLQELSGAWLAVAPEQTTVLGLPSTIVMPWGTVGCDAALSAARAYADQVRSDVQVPLVIPVSTAKRVR